MPDLEERSRAVLDWPELTARLADKAQSERGQELCREIGPSATPAEARERMAEVAEAAAVLRAGVALPGTAFPEVEPFLLAAEKGLTLTVEELRPVGDLCRTADALQRFFLRPVEGSAAPETPRLSALAAALDPCRRLADEIAATFDPSGEIRDSVSPELARLRRERDALSTRVRQQIEEVMRSDAFAPLLQDQFWTVRGERFVLPIKASAKSLGLGIVHDTSRTGETVFIEPAAVVETNNRLKLADLDIQRELRRILEELSRHVGAAAPALRQDLELLATFDVIAAKARLGVAYQGYAVDIVDDAVIALERARHPLLVLRDVPVVANDVVLGAGSGRVLVISGPNAGGKTVLLKTMGLAALLARAGMLVPAEPGSRVGFFDAVVADIGDAQTILGDLSTFSAHLANLATILGVGEGARRSLVLLDELMAGTNPDQGAALARAAAESVAGLPGLAVITTHYDALKALAEVDGRFINAGMEYDLERLTPTFRLNAGTPGRSYALDIAARMGLPAALLERARALAGSSSVGLEDVLARLEEREAALAAETDGLARARAEMEATAAEQREAARLLTRRERELAVHSREAVDASVREAREAIRAIVRNAQAAGTSRAAELARQELSETSRAALASLPAPPPAPAPPPPPALRVGARVFVPALGRDGVVIREPDARGHVKVTVGTLSVDVDAADLAGGAGAPRGTRPQGKGGPRGDEGGAPVAAPRREESLGFAIQSAQNTLDLRGRRADDVLDELEAYLDRAALDGRSPVFVIHGHGTGTLKKIVREYLARSPYVRRWSTGDRKQGGDGVSVVEL